MKRLFPWLLPAALAGSFWVSFFGACSSTPKDDSKITCSPPGKAFFCKCADLSDGEKICKPDGKSFEPCMQGSQPCPGGELLPDAGPTGDGGPTGPAEETCPGKVVTVEVGKPTVIDGDTSSSRQSQKGTAACADTDGPEHVYAVTPAAAGRLHVQAQALHDLTAYARSGDCATGPQVSCAAQVPAGGSETLDFAATAGQTYWIFIDGKADQSGKYALTVDLNTGPRCGDKIVQDGEACDDGNAVEDDGCSTKCLPAGDARTMGPCPGQTVHVWGPPVTWPGDTTNMGNDFKNTTACGGSTGVSGPDRVYAVTAHKTGTMSVATSNVTWDNMIYMSAACPTAGTPPRKVTDTACGDTRGTGGESMSFPVTSGQTYYVFVDGYLAYKGPYTMTIDIQ